MRRARRCRPAWRSSAGCRDCYGTRIFKNVAQGPSRWRRAGLLRRPATPFFRFDTSTPAAGKERHETCHMVPHESDGKGRCCQGKQ